MPTATANTDRTTPDSSSPIISTSIEAGNIVHDPRWARNIYNPTSCMIHGWHATYICFARYIYNTIRATMYHLVLKCWHQMGMHTKTQLFHTIPDRVVQKKLGGAALYTLSTFIPYPCFTLILPAINSRTCHSVVAQFPSPQIRVPFPFSSQLRHSLAIFYSS